MRSAPVAALFTALVMMSGSVFAAGPTKGDPAKGKEIVDKVCAACHGADGNSVVAANPRLAGQHPEYIYKQLTEFKTQKRKNAVMFGMASQLSDADMHNVAAYFSQQKPKEGGASDKTLIAAGEKKSIAVVLPPRACPPVWPVTALRVPACRHSSRVWPVSIAPM